MVWCVPRPSVCPQNYDLSLFQTHGIPLGLAGSSFLCGVGCVGVTGGAGVGEVDVNVGGDGVERGGYEFREEVVG